MEQPLFIALKPDQAFLATAFFLTLAGRDLPNEALAIFPFLVLISPRPIV